MDLLSALLFEGSKVSWRLKKKPCFVYLFNQIGGAFISVKLFLDKFSIDYLQSSVLRQLCNVSVNTLFTDEETAQMKKPIQGMCTAKEKRLCVHLMSSKVPVQTPNFSEK